MNLNRMCVCLCVCVPFGFGVKMWNFFCFVSLYKNSYEFLSWDQQLDSRACPFFAGFPIIFQSYRGSELFLVYQLNIINEWMNEWPGWMNEWLDWMDEQEEWIFFFGWKKIQILIAMDDTTMIIIIICVVCVCVSVDHKDMDEHKF